MYVERAPFSASCTSRDLDQGDIVAGLLLPDLPVRNNLCIRTDKTKIRWPATADELKTPSGQLIAQLRVQREPLCLVLSNSCDNAQGDFPVLVCPIRDFKLRPGSDVEQQWQQIQVAATGTANTKEFYLPARVDMTRSRALLASVYPLSHDYLAGCITEGGATRLAGLSANAVVHLQHTISAFFGRNPRDDYEWPSGDDLELKAQALRSKLARGGPDKERLTLDLARVESILRETTTG